MTMKWKIILVWWISISPYSKKIPKTIYTSSTTPVEIKATNLSLEYLTRTVQAEAVQTNIKDCQFVAQTIVNRCIRDSISVFKAVSAPLQFSGYNTHRYKRRLDTSLYRLLKPIYNRDTVFHRYYHFFNPYLSTDTAFVNYGLKQDGEWVGDHYYF